MSSNKTLVQIAILTALTITVQLAGLPQFFTGPFINGMLFLITYLISPWAGVGLSILTPLSAMIRGHLPAFLYPLLPFVILGNISLVLVFYFIQKRRDMTGSKVFMRSGIAILLAATLKTLLLTSAVYWILPVVMGIDLPSPVIFIMSIPQFFTAITGGILFMGLIRWIPSGYLKSSAN